MEQKVRDYEIKPMNGINRYVFVRERSNFPLDEFDIADKKFYEGTTVIGKIDNPSPFSNSPGSDEQWGLWSIPYYYRVEKQNTNARNLLREQHRRRFVIHPAGAWMSTARRGCAPSGPHCRPQ